MMITMMPKMMENMMGNMGPDSMQNMMMTMMPRMMGMMGGGESQDNSEGMPDMMSCCMNMMEQCFSSMSDEDRERMASIFRTKKDEGENPP